jgi:hypothetical protein
LILALLETPAEGFFWNLPEFGHRIRLDALYDWETCALEVGPFSEQGTRSGDYGGWVMTQEAMCGSVHYHDAETTVPA